jgi:hypothetical protein
MAPARPDHCDVIDREHDAIGAQHLSDEKEMRQIEHAARRDEDLVAVCLADRAGQARGG